MGAKVFGALRAQDQPGPRPSLSKLLGSHCAHESGPALLAQRDGASLGPLKPAFCSAGHLAQSAVPLIGSLGRVLPPEEEIEVRGPGAGLHPGSWGPEGGRLPQLPG